MNSSTTKSFRDRFEKLPAEIQKLAVERYRLWRTNPSHNSLRFKKVTSHYWSIRIGRRYRALGLEENGRIKWFWIGSHDEYMRLLRFKFLT